MKYYEVVNADWFTLLWWGGVAVIVLIYLPYLAWKGDKMDRDKRRD